MNQRVHLTLSQHLHMRDAIRHLVVVAEELDGSMTDTCGQCGRASAVNYAEYRLCQEFGGIIRRLSRLLPESEERSA